MPRSPFLRMLRRVADDHRAADRLGIPVQAVQEARFTRADILKRGGAIGAAAAIAGPGALLTRSARAATAPRIAVVGGGIAGLSTALTLADAGYRSTIYEANASRLGGRMHSDAPGVSGGDDYFSGQVAEYCGEFFDSDHNTIISLAKRFALPLDDVLAAQPNHSTETYYFFGQYYSYDQASSDFQPVHNALQSQVSKTSYPTLWNLSTQAGRDLDNISVYQWIEQYVPGGHGSPFGRLLDAAYNEEYGAETTDQSSLNIIYLLGYKAKPGNFQIYGASDERFHMRGGNQQLPETIASYLQSTGLVQIVQTARMNTVVLNRDNTVSLWFDGSSVPVTCDRAVLCMSFPVLRTLDYSKAGFDLRKVTAITQLGAGRNAKLQLQFDSRLWNQSGPWGISNGDVYTDLGFQNVWDVTRAQPGTNGILVNYSGGNVAGAFKPSTPYSNASSNKQVTTYAKAFLSSLEKVFPGITKHWNGKAILSTPFLDPNLLCSYAYWKVGQYQSFSGYEKAPMPGPAGPIHFAGEHCSQDFQGYMEGGAAEGVRAGNEIISLITGK